MGVDNKAHHDISTVCVYFIFFFSLSEEEEKTTQKLPPKLAEINQAAATVAVATILDDFQFKALVSSVIF